MEIRLWEFPRVAHAGDSSMRFISSVLFLSIHTVFFLFYSPFPSSGSYSFFFLSSLFFCLSYGLLVSVLLLFRFFFFWSIFVSVRCRSRMSLRSFFVPLYISFVLVLSSWWDWGKRLYSSQDDWWKLSFFLSLSRKEMYYYYIAHFIWRPSYFISLFHPRQFGSVLSLPSYDVLLTVSFHFLMN